MHYKTRYEERHQPIDTTGEAEMLNYFQPKRCPFCESEDFIKYGHDNNGIDRYAAYLDYETFKKYEEYLVGRKWYND